MLEMYIGFVHGCGVGMLFPNDTFSNRAQLSRMGGTYWFINENSHTDRNIIEKM